MIRETTPNLYEGEIALNHAYYNRNRAMAPRSLHMTRMTGDSCPCEMARMPMEQEDCDHMVLAMSYVLMQGFGMLYEPDAGFSQGTIFPELDKPLMVGGSLCG